jgi:two-component sensor histidine kinase
MLWVALPVGGIATVFGIMAALSAGYAAVVVLDVGLYGVLIVITTVRRIPRIVRASIAVGGVYLLAAALLIGIGPGSAALLLLLVPVFTAAVIISARATIIVGVAVVALLAVVTVLLLLGRLPWTLPPWTWATHVATFLVVGALMTAGSLFLIRRIAGALEQERAHAGERATLLSEIQHRVKNNLQVMVSLLRIQANAADRPEVSEALHRAEARVLAMFLAYEQVYRHSSDASIELSTLLRKVSQESVRLKFGRYGKATVTAEARPVNPERAVSVALLVEELIVGYPAIPREQEPIEFTLTAGENAGAVELTVTYPGVWSDSDRVGVPEYQIVLALTDQAGAELTWAQHGANTECTARLASQE